MTIDEIYQYCLDLSNKDVKGLAFSVNQFNNTLQFVNIDLFRKAFTSAVSYAKENNADLDKAIWAISDLRNFIKTGDLFPAQMTVGSRIVGRAAYPTDFKYCLSLMGDNRDVEVEPITKLGRVRSGVLNKNFSESPVAFCIDEYFEYYPNDLATLVLTYLKTPTEPYYDYCVSSDDLDVFMPAGSYIIYLLPTGKYNLYASGGTLIEADVTHTYFEGTAPSPSVTYSSLTAELEWDETKHIEIANMVLEKMGVNLRSPEITQYAAAQ